MGSNLRALLEDWPRNFIRDKDLTFLLEGKSNDARHSLVKRALQAKLLTRLKKGLYLITSKTKQILPDEFELASVMYEPSFVSLESALSYHGWIPEAVLTTASVTPRRSQSFQTPLGNFFFEHVPANNFYLGVSRIESPTGVALIAQPWRAIADFMYTTKRSWSSLDDLELDLRIDKETALESDLDFLSQLTATYPSKHVQQSLKILLRQTLSLKIERTPNVP